MLLFPPLMLDPDIEIEPDPHAFQPDKVWTVTDVTNRVKTLIERDPGLSGVSVRGEVTNLSASKAGHIYFGLKDQKSYLKCVAFRSDAEQLSVKPNEGREIVATGRLNVWPAGGSYQLVVNRIQDVGLGALWLEFEETRRKLAAEGLFDEDIKRPLPMFPRQVGLVTSRTGAAVRDMIRIFSERAPYVKLVLSPSLVQGETAPGSLVGALNLLELWSEIERSEGREGLDLIIIGRGGGSFEDLACFNDEGLVRRIRATGVPVISAVGHEVDFTIIDFASDVRAATPTQAAQIAAPSADELMGEVATLLLEIRGDTEIKIETYRTGVGNLLSRPVYRRPLDRVNNLRQNIDALSARSGRAAWNHLKFLKQHLQSSIGRLESLDPTVILSRGYSLAFNRDSGKLISKTEHVMEGTLVDLRVSDGYIKMRVEEETERP
jgi:exodeoxyribonuclease VII large subunit